MKLGKHLYKRYPFKHWSSGYHYRVNQDRGSSTHTHIVRLYALLGADSRTALTEQSTRELETSCYHKLYLLAKEHSYHKIRVTHIVSSQQCIQPASRTALTEQSSRELETPRYHKLYLLAKAHTPSTRSAILKYFCLL